ncbi:adenine-specific DNA-methyltransferase [Catalinimonas alkaloidigena]|uniref:site-specific DNA-methyltransferase (adenine-specific) n=2 Tax=Catalinimonas alkaloidigena TaxID=1075417 RepID=A0A1G9AYC4_9BACT|nr:adenine-specific DNA-methyltransferase [Catalinimonas alkaloidigena]
MPSLLEELHQLLRHDARLVSEGTWRKNKLQDLIWQLDAELLRLLRSHPRIRARFFREVDGVCVFDQAGFQQIVTGKDFLPDSYTAYKNQLGLTSEQRFLSASKDVVLAWPYKDGVLEGGQTQAADKTEERFWHETLAAEEIDWLLAPKALHRFRRITAHKQAPAERLTADEHLLIKGNNLLTLCTLRARYAEKVKLIYIDPPYNTGKDTFGYNDRFSHATWLTFMKNRLEVARTLLRPDGVMFISIDSHEQAYLKVLCDELFGREHFVGEIVWETATDNNATQISVEHEYVLCYAKDKRRQGPWKIQSEKAQRIQQEYETLKQQHPGDLAAVERGLRRWLTQMRKSKAVDLSGVAHYAYVDEKGVFYPGNSANTRPGGYHYDLLHPTTGKVCKRPTNGYRWPEATFRKADGRGDVLWGADETTIPKIKKRLDTATELLKGYFYEDNRRSTQALTQLMGRKAFANPKSINLLKKLIRFTTGAGDLVLDFFAGSGSTAQAVLEVNRAEGARRRFILCEQLDYIETLTLPRIQKALGEDTLVYAELAGLNQPFVEQIQAAGDHAALQTTWETMRGKARLDWRLNAEALETVAAQLTTFPLPEARQLLLDLLDKNQLYVPLSEMADTDYGLTETDQRLNGAY